MTQLALLISPRAEGAFFGQTLEVARAELRGCRNVGDITVAQHGDMVFLNIEAEQVDRQDLARLSCIHGIFEMSGEALTPVAQTTDFKLHSDFVWGEKYRGKTSEILTQLLINVALQELDAPIGTGLRLLDPMCGRGTTLMWAMRYGIRSVGVERDANVLRDLRRSLKKWTKLHRQKHKLSEGWVRKINKKGIGQHLDFTAEGCDTRVIVGDTRETHDLTLRKPFDLIVTDLPYGVQHQGSEASRSPIDSITEAAPGWVQAMAPGAVMAIAFNAYIPKRADLIDAFEGFGLEVIDRGLKHRMSEAILRDVLILRKPH